MTRSVQMTTAIEVKPDLWATSMLPEGILERWLRPEGSQVEAGDPVAAIRIEDALHELMAPARGRLYTELKVDSVIEPGAVIGRIVRWVHNA
jgi:pyruvate/2-oxoglutarate dehydrogenase complex dihydrolipoamide acyltransferase (E2) component